MFLNINAERIVKNRPADPQHKVLDFDFSNNLNGGHFSLIIVIFYLVRRFLIDPCLLKSSVKSSTTNDTQMQRSQQRQSILGDDDDKWKINENLPIFWKALSGDVQKTWYVQSIYDKQAYDINSVLDDQLESLRTTKRALKQEDLKKRVFNSIYNYDILSNSRYQYAFQFSLIPDRIVPDELPLNDEGEYAPYENILTWRMSDFVSKVMNGAQQDLCVDYSEE